MNMPHKSCNGGCGSTSELIHEVREYGEDLSDQDVWGDEEYVNPHADRDRSQQKQGYLDGLVQGKEEGLQKGFDEAFPKGADLGFTVGRILAQLKCKNESLYIQAKSELNITQVLNTSHFDEELDLKGTHETIAKWEQKLKE